MNFAEPPEEKLRIELSGPQWELLQTARANMDEDLARCVSVAVKRGEHYELYLAWRDIDDLVEHLEDCAEEAPGTPQADNFLNLADYLSDIADLSDDEDMVFDDDDFGPSADIQNRSAMTGGVFVFKVALVEAKTIWRRIALRGGQTLHDLHEAIFEAFDREEEHLYAFHIPPAPSKSQSVRKYLDFPEYAHPYAREDDVEMVLGLFFGRQQPQDAAQTTIEDLNLADKHRMLYLFDFGDEWLHWVTVEQIDGRPDEGDYPRILERKGDSPPQYYDDELNGQDEDGDWDTPF